MSTKKPTMARLCRDDPEFSVVSVADGWSAEPAAPTLCSEPALRDLLIVVHPGDAVEHPQGWGNREDARKAVEFGLGNQVNMAREMQVRLNTSQCIVLHRESSVQLISPSCPPWVDPAYAKTVSKVASAGASLYGDDLEAAADWIIANCDLQPGRRVFMTGAYSDLKHGCITALCSLLLAHAPTLEVEVDLASPTDSSNSSPRYFGTSTDAGATKRLAP